MSINTAVVYSIFVSICHFPGFDDRNTDFLLLLMDVYRLSVQVQYRKSTSIRHFEQCNQQLSNLICQNCDGSIKILLDVENQQHAV